MATDEVHPATASVQEVEVAKEVTEVLPGDEKWLRGNSSSSFRFRWRRCGEDGLTRGQESKVELSQPKMHQQPQAQLSQRQLQLQQSNVSPVFETACDRTKCSVCAKLPFRYRERLVQTVIWEGAGTPPLGYVTCQPAPANPGSASQAPNAPTGSSPQEKRRQNPDVTTQQQQQRQRELMQQQQVMWDLVELGLFDFAPRIILDRHPKVERAIASRIASIAERQIRQINRELARAGLSTHNRHPNSSNSSSCSSSKASSTASQQQRRHSRHASQNGSVTTAATVASSTLSRENESFCKSQRKPSISTESTTSWWSQSRIIASFVKTEIVTGEWLGSGGFSCVFEVISFQPDEEVAVNAVQQAARAFMSKHAQRQVNIPVGKLRQQKASSRRGDHSQVTEARYAMKHLRYGLADDMKGSRFEEAAVDLVREGCVLAGLDHPNIIRIHGWSHHGAEVYRTGYYTDYFLILDKMTETLEGRIWRWRQSFKKYKMRVTWPLVRNKFMFKMQRLWIDRTRAALHVAHGLAYLHKHGLMHRDIKPSNVGFDVRGDIKIFDFGLSRLVPRDEDCTEEFDPASKTVYEMSRVGTKYYMAPEVRKKEPYNVSADVYSYGVLLWEILTLCNPRDAVKKLQPSKEDVDHGERWLPLCPCWPKEIRQIVKDCLSSNPHHRPTMEHVVTVLTGHLIQQEDRQYDTFDISQSIAEGSEEYGSFVARRRSTFQLDLSGIDFSEFNDSCSTSNCSSSNMYGSNSVVSTASAAHSRCSSQYSPKDG